MKKIMLMTAVLMFLGASSAFAAYDSGTVTLGPTTGHQMDIQTSNNVQLDYAAGGSQGETFVVATYHSKGTRTYASSSADANIFYQDATAVTLPTAPTGSGTMDSSSWTTL